MRREERQAWHAERIGQMHHGGVGRNHEARTCDEAEQRSDVATSRNRERAAAARITLRQHRQWLSIAKLAHSGQQPRSMTVH